MHLTRSFQRCTGWHLPELLVGLAVALYLCFAASPAKADWSGWEGGAGCVPTGTTIAGRCESLAQACQSWADFRETWVRRIKPTYSASGEISGATCYIRHFLAVGSDFQDPTDVSCSPGYEVNGNVASGCQLVVPRRALGRCTDECKMQSPEAVGSPDGGPTVGNPISLATGNKFEAVTDYRSGGSQRLSFTRYYNSQSKVTGKMGPAWRHGFERRLVFVNSSRTDYHAADGKVFVFTKVGSDWVPDSDVVLRLSFAGDAWQLTDKADRVESYDAGGKLTTITEKDGYQRAFEYAGPNSSLSLVHDSHGHRLRLAYNADGLLESIADDAGRRHVYHYRKIYDYELQPATLLEAVLSPDDTPLDPDDNPRVQYLYEDADFPVALTGIIDERGARYATWSYDEEGRAISSEHAGATDLNSVVYNPDGSREVTNPLGQETVYTFTPINGLPRVSQIERLAGPNTAAATFDFTYDANGFLASTTDWEGNVTNYVYDSRGLLTSKTEAVGAAAERTTTTTWHNDFRLPTQIVMPRQTVDLTYDDDGLLVSRQVTDTTSHVLPYPTNGQTRTWSYSYSDGGEVPGAETPLPDVPLTLTNPNAETANTTGWVVTEGAFTVRSSTPAPNEGSYYFYAGAAASSRMHQDVAIPGGTASEVDSGQRSVRVQWTQNSYAGSDRGTVILRFLDAMDQVIGDRYEYLKAAPTTWKPREFSIDVPPLTRKMRIELRAIRGAGTNNDAYFDELEISLVQRSQTRMSLTLQNPDAETGDLTGWTSELGAFNAYPGSVQGDYRFHPGTVAQSRISQVVPFPQDQHDAIDEGLRSFELTWLQDSYQGNDRGAAILEFLDGTGSQIGLSTESSLTAPTSWLLRKLDGAVPAGARSVRISLRAVRSSGTYNDAYFDFLHASLIGTDVAQLPLPRRLVSVDGPRSDVTDTTTFGYDDYGKLENVTNALGHVTSITERDDIGLPLSLLDENGIETALAYDARHRLVESRVRGVAGDAVTTYGYDAASLLTTVTLPDGSRLTYEYDDAHRLTAIANELGERIEYTLDDKGNRTAEVLRASGGAIVRSQSRAFDELGRLLERLGAASQVTAFGYDSNGNLTSTTDPLSGVLAQAFDPLDRLVQQTDPESGVTTYAYDAEDNLVSVTDPRGLTTTYTYNGFGEVIQLDSPDTGATVFTLDAAGNAISQTDARGVVTTFTYDAVNRPLTRSYPATPVDNVAYGYDDTGAGNRGVGRLTSVTDDSGSTELVYDGYGRQVSESRTIGGVVYTTGYSYDLAGNLLQMTYPDGRIVSYGRDALGRVTSILTQPDAASAPIVVASDIDYLPFGPVASLTFGNGVALTYTYDQDYRLTAIAAGDGVTDVQDLTLAYDNADNITAITDLLDSARDQTFQYDGLYRLTEAEGLYGTIGYDYDAVGNRTERSIVDSLGTLIETYTYDTASNRLLSLSDGTTTQSFSYSASGQITADDRGAGTDLGFVYDDSDRLVQLQSGGLPDADYLHNAFGERVAKELVGTSDVTHFHYGPGGQLLGESDALGAFQRSYIYLDGLPIAQIEPLGGGSPTQTDETLDNEDIGVLVEGAWVSADSLPGHEGSDYLVHPGAGPVPAGGTILDNSSPAFSTTGLWPASSDRPGFEGADYQSRSASGPFGAGMVVDNQDPQTVIVEAWRSSTNISGYVGSDYLWYYPGDGSASVTWPLNTSASGFSEYYVVETIWPGYPNRATDAPYTVNHVGGSTTVTKNQETDPGWSSLGSYLIPGDGSGSVVLTNQANSYVVADAVRLTVDTSVVRTATWVYTAPESGNYRVFARWPAGEGQANAKYTVQHSGGSATVTMNQGQGGGQWNELGTFAFAGGQDYAVSLSDDANGIVVADAVYIVKVEELTDAVTWVPDLPASGTYQVYAKWTANETRATDARYSIVHSGGTAEVSVNQRAAGGLWQYLGSYAFDPLSSPTVTLAANDNGSVAADAVRFVGGPGGATDIAYLHSDHLGTPQVMTDANAQVLWWRDQTPFGQTVAEGGFSSSPLRFPGQYADTESGLAYNYFRDYDPATGRYIQSDPIGLGGGINTYRYVNQNPLSTADRYGLFCGQNCDDLDHSGIPDDSPLEHTRFDDGTVCDAFGTCLSAAEIEEYRKRLEEGLYCSCISPAIGIGADVGTLVTIETAVGPVVFQTIGATNTATTMILCGADPTVITAVLGFFAKSKTYKALVAGADIVVILVAAD